jgi:guanylate kinase
MAITNGTLFIISAPSGTGKTSLVNELVKRLHNVVISISHTTRHRRMLEQHGQHYYFVDVSTFQTMIQQNVFLEYVNIFDNFYRTSRTFVEDELSKGNDVILEIDWQGANKIKENFPHSSISIFILPPNLIILQQRLFSRKQDSNEVIEKRIAQAPTDIKQYKNYDYVITNDSFEKALDELMAIIKARRVSLTVAGDYLQNFVDNIIN